MDNITLMKMKGAWRQKARGDKTKIRDEFNEKFNLSGERSINHRLYQEKPKLEDEQEKWLRDKLGV